MGLHKQKVCILLKIDKTQVDLEEHYNELRVCFHRETSVFDN